MYAALKWLHVACVMLSGAGFLARGVLMLAGSELLRTRFVRVAPHVVDSLLLAAAVSIAVLARLSPHEHPWLATKIGGLLLYIVLGSLALRPGRPPRVRALAFAGAVLTFAYIVGTALQRDPLWPLRLA
jgi:uncharacterized membrane protein SirB2